MKTRENAKKSCSRVGTLAGLKMRFFEVLLTEGSSVISLFSIPDWGGGGGGGLRQVQKQKVR